MNLKTKFYPESGVKLKGLKAVVLNHGVATHRVRKKRYFLQVFHQIIPNFNLKLLKHLV